MKRVVQHCFVPVLASMLILGAFGFWQVRPAHADSCGACSFIFTTTSANTSGYITYVNNPQMNGQPNLTVEITQIWPSAYDAHPVGVWYNGNEWTIFNEDRAAITVGTSFTVNFGYLGTESASVGFSHTATASNSSGDSTYLDNPYLNNTPSAKVFVTQRWTGTYDPHEIGVWYTQNGWAIYNEDGTAIPAGSSFFVFVETSANDPYVLQTASAANTAGYITYIDNPAFNGAAGLIVQMNHVYNANNACGCFLENHPIGVWYNTSLGKWSIYNVDGAPMVAGTTFYVQAMTNNLN